MIADPSRRIVLDTTSLICPYPYLKAKEALEGMSSGDELELLTDNEATVQSSVPALARRFRAEVDVHEEPGRWRVVFRRV